MGTKELIKEISKLPKEERLFIIEKTLSAIRKEEISSKLKKAANLLYEDYSNDPDLTAFTALDSEEFYEPR